MTVDPNSQLVKELLTDSVSVAKLVEDFGKMSVVLMARLIDDHRRELAEHANEIRRLKLKIEGLEKWQVVLQDQLKKRFAAIDAKLGTKNGNVSLDSAKGDR